MRKHLELFACGARVIMALVFYCLGMSKVMAQEECGYVPFVEEGKVWYCGYEHIDPDKVSTVTPEDPEGVGIDCIFTMCGDTLVNDREYKKVYCQFEEYYGDKEQHYYCSVREEARRVFIIEEETKEEKLIYDFSRPGETITVTYNDYQFARTDGGRFQDFPPSQLIYTVGLFTEDGEVDYSNDSGWWMDGVGSILNNPFALELDFLFFDEPKLGKDIGVITCMKDGKYYYKPEWISGPVEPASINERNHVDNSQEGSHLYDQQGRRVDKTPCHGVYIQNGRKFVVR